MSRVVVCTVLLAVQIFSCLSVLGCGGTSSTQAETSPEGTQVVVNPNPPALDTQADATPIDQTTPGSLRYAVQLLDMRMIELPEGTTSAQGNAATATAIVEGTIVDVYPFFVEQFKRRGWDESREPGSRQVAADYAQTMFAQRGYLVSLSIFPADPAAGTVNVTLRNHGKLDTRTLPAPADATVLFGSQPTTMLVTETSVDQTVEQCRERLAAIGWYEFGPSRGQAFDGVEQAFLAFCQGGAELSAFIAKAPAQGGKTSIQFSTQLLPGQLPWPDDAQQLEFDPQRMSLACRTALGMAEAADFFRVELVGLGWQHRDDLDNADDTHGAFYFDDEQRNRLMVTLDRRDADLTKVSVEFVPAEVLAALAQSEAVNVAELTELPVEPNTASEPVEPSSMQAHSLPMPEGAGNVEFNRELQEITFRSEQGVEALIELFRMMMPECGWQEEADFTLATDNVGSMRMIAGNASLDFTLLRVSSSSGTEVRIATRGLAWDEHAATRDSDSTQREMTEQQPLVAEEKDGFPIPRDYTSYESQSTNFRQEVLVVVPAAMGAVVEFIRRELPEYQLQELKDSSTVGEAKSALVFEGAQGSLYVHVEGLAMGMQIRLDLKNAKAAEEAGILPSKGKARIIFGNMAEAQAEVTVDRDQASLQPGEGQKKPDGPTFEVEPGKRVLTSKVGNENSREEIEVGPDETWAILIDEHGILPLRMY